MKLSSSNQITSPLNFILGEKGKSTGKKVVRCWIKGGEATCKVKIATAFVKSTTTIDKTKATFNKTKAMMSLFPRKMLMRTRMRSQQ